ncbi:hypothetical protein SBOR_3990 [Sclerotinia borealis F-4128]|uniref:Bud22 domain-containing protein n=1 Tax=Sclerotinia borealis (strain F-4128) TaxID=1432307 RepID=W9CLQ7_SCLBF|nr:hypothetical protein SBOR_3990 [Sclerotinia borealis F-4128]
MPKRKRSDDQDDSTPSTNRVRNSRQNDFDIHLISARKQLRSALKTAKGFERQRLGKRLTNATKIVDAAQMARLRKEIEALKLVDLDKVVEQRLAKGLGKIKVMAESGFLPVGWGQSGEGVKGWEGEKGEEDVRVWNNVVSGMWNFKIVKGVWEGVIRGSYMSMGIPAPVLEKGKKGKEKVNEKAKGDDDKTSSRKGKAQSVDAGESDVYMEDTIPNFSKKENKEDSWEGFDSPGDDEDEDDSEDDENEEGNASMDEETLSRYDALLGASSDEESFDEEEYLKKTPSTSKSNPRLSLSLSPTPSRSPSPVPSISQSSDDEAANNKFRTSHLSPSPQPEPKAKRPKKPSPNTAPTKSSTFLPTLMGGYWSGSDSSASSLSDTDMKPVIRKNRMGQKARQALAEKKFGKGAAHIAAGKMSMEEEREAKRAEKTGKKVRDFGSRAGGRREYGNANDVEVKPREKVKTRDDVGILHPSWEAAKKAKDEKAKATFSGKKVVFD